MGSEVQILSGAMVQPYIQIFTAGPLETHCILLGCRQTKHAAIFDAPDHSLQPIIRALEKENLKPQMLCLTHSHWDHIADAAKIQEHFAIPLYLHSEDVPNLEKPGADHLPLMFPIKGTKPDHLLKDGQVLHLGTIEIHVIHTPGHTPGSVCFWMPEEKLLISGDTLFQGSIGNLSFPTSRPDLMRGSLKKLAKLPPETQVIPGHGEETTIGDEEWILNGGMFDE